MSIENSWNQLDDQQDDDLLYMLQKPALSKLSSHSPLEKIRKNLLINMIWAFLICLFYIGIIIYFHIWQVQIPIFAVLIFTLWGLYSGYQIYGQIKATVSTGPLLAELKRHHQTITTWIHAQQRVGLFIYPISAAGGFMLGGVLGSGKPVEVFMSKPIVLAALVISIIVLVPACYYLARWMCKYSFGKHLDALKENIRELEEEK